MKDSTQYTHDAAPYASLHDENGVCYKALTLLVEDQQPSMNLKLQTFMYRSGLLSLYSCPTPASPLYIIAQLSSTVYTSGYNLHSILQYLNQICLTVSCILIVLFSYILSQFPCRSLSFILVMAGTGFLLLALFYLLIDVIHWWNGSPFSYPDENQLSCLLKILRYKVFQLSATYVTLNESDAS